MTDTSTQPESVRVLWWRTALSVALSFVMLAPGAVFGLMALLASPDLGPDDLVAPGLVIPVVTMAAFVAATFTPHLILRQGADHRLARIVFAALCILAAAAGVIDYIADREGPVRGLLGAPTGALALYAGLGLAAAIGGGLWGTYEATRPPPTGRQGRRRNPPKAR